MIAIRKNRRIRSLVTSVTERIPAFCCNSAVFLRVLFLIPLCLTLFLHITAGADSASVVKTGDRIYLGEWNGEPVSWIVLDSECQNNGEPGMFLWTEYVIQTGGIRYSGGYAEWENSVAQSWCATFYEDAFSEIEKTVIPATYKAEDRSELYGLYWRPADLNGEHVFFISAPELAQYVGAEDGCEGITGYSTEGNAVYYWLRSPHGYHADYSGLVLDNNQVHDYLCDINWGGRPAMNLNPGSIIYYTATETGEHTTWKVALVDDGLDFEVTGCKANGTNLSIGYSASFSGTECEVAAVVFSNEGALDHTASLGHAEQNGTVQFELQDLGIPDGGSISLCLLQRSGDFRPDTVSHTIPIEARIRFQPGEGSGTMETVLTEPGSVFVLPDSSFEAPEHKQFDHWESDGKRLDDYVTVEEDITLTAVYVDIPVNEIRPSFSEVTLPWGKTIEAVIQVLPEEAANQQVIVSSEKTFVAEAVLSDDGMSVSVQAKRPGTAQIALISADGNACIFLPVTVTGNPFFAFFSHEEGLITAAVITTVVLAAVYALHGRQRWLILLVIPMLMVIAFFVLPKVQNDAINNGEDEQVITVTPEPSPEPEPTPEPFLEPEMNDGTPVVFNGKIPANGSYLHGDVLYIRLSDAVELLNTELKLDESTNRFSFSWRKSVVQLSGDSAVLEYDGRTVIMEAETLPCDEGKDLFIPVQSLSEAIDIGILYDEEYDTLYCTPGAGAWELPQGYDVPILMYHGTGSASGDANLIVSGASLEEQLSYLASNGYTTIWFEDLWNVDNIEKPVILTFDDGWANNYTVLYPLLEKYNCKASIAIVESFVDHSAIHLTSEQIVELANSPYVRIQSHTVGHEQSLDSLSEERQRYEMEESRLYITRLTGREPEVLVYPSGGANSITLRLVSDYYRFGVRMHNGRSYNTSDDPTLVYRFYVGRDTLIAQYRAMLENVFPMNS